MKGRFVFHAGDFLGLARDGGLLARWVRAVARCGGEWTAGQRVMGREPGEYVALAVAIGIRTQRHDKRLLERVYDCSEAYSR